MLSNNEVLIMNNRFKNNNELYASRLKLLQRPDARSIIYPGSI